jgi:hypothetical protein
MILPLQCNSLLRNLCPRCLTVFVNRIRSPIESVIFSRSNTLNFRAWSSGNCFSTPSLPTMTAHSSRSSNLFQVLANLAMEPPPRTDSESIRNEKVKVLKAIPPLERANHFRFRISPKVTLAFGMNVIAPGEDTISESGE